MGSRKLKDKDMQDKFEAGLSKEMKENSNKHDWDKLKVCLTTAAAKICGKHKMVTKQNWIAEDILEVVEERRNFNFNRLRHVELTNELRRMHRKAKQEYHESLRKDVDKLERRRNPKAYSITKKLTNKELVAIVT